jgi:hypothetical protein
VEEATGNESVESSPQEIESQSDSLANDLAADLYPDHERTEAEDHEFDDIEVKPEETEEIAEKVEPEVEVKEPKQAPKSWTKEMQAKFSTLPPDIQDYVELRENQMKQGLENDRSDANLGRVMRDTMTPYRAMLQAQGVNEAQAVQSLMNVHYKLTNLSPAEKTAYGVSILKGYGIEIPGMEAEEAAPIDPTVRKLQEELNGIKQNLTRAQESTINQAKERVQRDVEAFATDASHPYFDEVADDIAVMIQGGHDLESAYEKAVWANPVTRQKELARLQTEQQASIREKAMKEAETARKAASLNVRTRDTSRTPTGPKGTMRNLDSVLEETMREMKSRTH